MDDGFDFCYFNYYSYGFVVDDQRIMTFFSSPFVSFVFSSAALELGLSVISFEM